MPNSDPFNKFHHLVKKGELQAIRKFVESGANVNIRNEFDWTPLMLVAIRGDTSILSYLLSKNAEVNAINNFGASALAYAALEGKCGAMQMLLDAGASIDVHPHGVSLLQFAKTGGGRFVTQKHFTLLEELGAK